MFEGAAVVLFGVLGFPGAAALAFAMARRGRMLVVGLAGVAVHLVASSMPALRGPAPAPALATVDQRRDASITRTSVEG